MTAEGEARPALVRAGAEVRAGSVLATFGSKVGAVIVSGTVAGGDVGSVVGDIIPDFGTVAGTILSSIGAVLGTGVSQVLNNVASTAPRRR